MLDFKKFITEANLGGKRSSGENAWDSYIHDDPDWADLDIAVIKDVPLRDVVGKELRTVKRGAKIKLLSKEKSLSGRSYIAHVDVEGTHGYLPLTVLSKPLYADRVKNKGDVSEGLLAAGLAAKFSAPDSTVTTKDIHAVLDRLKKTGTSELTLKSTSKDRISLKININRSAMEELLDVSKQNLLKAETRSVIAYVNSKHVTQYTQHLSKNNSSDVVEIISDGVSDQKGTKVDLTVKINGKVTDINLSLKSGSTKQMGQVAGATPEKQEEFWKLFGVDVMKGMNKGEFLTTTPEKWLHTVYKKAADLINKHLGTDQKEFDFIETLSKGIKHAAVLGDDTVSLVHLSGGSFKVLRFADLHSKLKAIQLEAVYSGEAAVPSVYIIDKKSKRRLISMRVKREGRENSFYYRNYIEKQELMIELTTVD